MGCAADEASTPAALPGSRYLGTAADCAPIRGEKPFAVSLSGKSDAADPSARVYAGAVLYFPRGRVAFAPVLIASGTLTTSLQLDASLSVRDISLHDPDCGGGWSGDLVGPTGGINAVVSNNVSGTSDNLRFKTGAVTMCATGEAPPQRVLDVGDAIFPTSDVVVRVARPVDGSSLDAVSAQNAFGVVPLNVRVSGNEIHIASATGLFAPFHETTFDLSGLRDILGMPLGIATKPRTMPLPTTPAAAAPFEVAATNLFSIGGDAAAKRLRISHRATCPTGSLLIRVAVVAANGVMVALRPPCTSYGVEQLVELTGVAPYAMYVQMPSSYARRPCNYYGSSPSSPPASTYSVASLSFE